MGIQFVFFFGDGYDKISSYDICYIIIDFYIRPKHIFAG